MAYIYILGTIIFTVLGQLLLKWRIPYFGILPLLFLDKIAFLIKLLFDPFIFMGFLSAFIASFFWMAAMTKVNLSFAYPFMGLNFVLVFVFSIILFKEPFSLYKIMGLSLIIIGIFISSRSV